MAWRAHITMRILLHFLYTACLLSYFSKFSSSIRVTIGVRMTEWQIDRMQVSSRCQLFVQWGTQWTRPPWWMECGMFRCSTSSYIYTPTHKNEHKVLALWCFPIWWCCNKSWGTATVWWIIHSSWISLFFLLTFRRKMESELSQQHTPIHIQQISRKFVQHLNISSPGLS